MNERREKEAMTVGRRFTFDQVGAGEASPRKQ